MKHIFYCFCSFWMTVSLAQAEEGEVFSFDERQEQLVSLARIFGGLHHLQMTCYEQGSQGQLFRDRMTELVTLEDPFLPTRNRMIEAFNEEYQLMKATHGFCTDETFNEMTRYAREGDGVVTQLAQPFQP